MVVPDVLRNKLLAVLYSGGDLIRNELTESHCMGLRLKLKIKTIMDFLNSKALFGCIMLDDELFKEQEGPLVIDSLSDLSHCYPSVRSVRFLAVVALLVRQNVLHYEALLKKGSVHNFFLNGQLNLEPLRMRFSIDESGVYKFDVFHAFKLLEADG